MEAKFWGGNEIEQVNIEKMLAVTFRIYCMNTLSITNHTFLKDIFREHESLKKYKYTNY